MGKLKLEMRCWALSVVCSLLSPVSSLADTYYVNDTSTDMDAWCTAIGSDTNSGTFPSQPKATVQALLAAHDLEPGDTVRIDTGNYLLASNIVVSANHTGSALKPVVFESSPYGVVMDRESTESGRRGWHVQADFITMRTGTSSIHGEENQKLWRICGAYEGILLEGVHGKVLRIELDSNSYVGLYCSGDNAIVQNCLIHHNDVYGVYARNAAYSVVENCTVALNGSTQVQTYWSTMPEFEVRNCILWADGSGAKLIDFDGNYLSYSDYNLFFMTDGATFGKRYQGDLIAADSFAEWKSKTGQDSHSTEDDPRFVDHASGDWHLQSLGGSYHEGAWSSNATTSAGIDLGWGEALLEPEPNTSAQSSTNIGSRNVGAYGGTKQASKTPSVRALRLYAPAGRENHLNQAQPIPVRWGWFGTAWQPNDTVKLEYSDDSGETWQTIADAEALTVNSGSNAWDSSSLPAGQFYQVRVSCNQEQGVTDQSRADFRIGEGLLYYVNDTSTTQDVWCTAIGSDTNSGVSPSQPMATIQAVLAVYDLEAGDTVRIDTGNYLLTNNIMVGPLDGGSDRGQVVFEASPNGVVMDRADTTSGSHGWTVTGDYITMRTALSSTHGAVDKRWWSVHGANRGVALTGSHYTLERIEVYSNSTAGVYASGDYGTICNCLSHHNGSFGFFFSSGDYQSMENCTAALNGSVQITTAWSSMPGFDVRNCILWADGPETMLINFEGPSLSSSDHNLIYMTGEAIFGERYQGTHVAADTFAEWRTFTGQDLHSIEDNPRFADHSGDDWHLQSLGGSYHDGMWNNDPTSSPGIDLGIGGAGQEPVINTSALSATNTGSRNVGAYGGTEQASRTPPGRSLRLLAPTGHENHLDQAQPIPIRWGWIGTAWQSNDTVKLEYSDDSGETWQTIADAEVLTVNSGSNAWDSSSLPAGQFYQVRVTCNQEPGVTDKSRADFRIGEGLIYYVNDTSTTQDVWCTAIGSDTNSGALPSQPKATVQALLAAHDLEPGDTVRIDTGRYLLTNNIVVETVDGGADTQPVVFEASPYGVIMDRASTVSGSDGWHVQANYITMRTALNTAHGDSNQTYWRIHGANRGIWMAGSHYNIERIETDTHGYAGIFCTAGHGTVRNCLSHHNAIVGIYASSTIATLIENCTVALNGSVQVHRYWSSGTGLEVRNCILWADGPGSKLIKFEGFDLAYSDYNHLYITSGATIGDRYQGTSSTIAAETFPDWRLKTGQDTHSIGGPVHFVDALGGDWHLQSTAGSYHGGTWSNDAVNDTGIDLAWGDMGMEPEPNTSTFSTTNTGSRNVGAYGGMEQASKTPSVRALRLYAPVGGENYLGQSQPVPIRWGWYGTAWQSNDTVRLEYSSDSGSTWQTISGAEALALNGGSNSWDISALPVGLFYRIRVVSDQEPAVTDESQGDIRIGTGIVFYVNDSATTQDLWCTAIGSDTNSGALPSQPKATVQSLLSKYDLEPGDTVRIDTGNYLLTNNIIVEPVDGGSTAGAVVFEASPYGVVMDRADTTWGNHGWEIKASYITLRTATSHAHGAGDQHWWRLHGGSRGISISGSNYAVERIEADSNTHAGIYCDGPYGCVRNCLVHHNSVYGIYVTNADGGLIENCTTALNGSFQLHQHWSSMPGLAVRNCIFWADGSGAKLVRYEGYDQSQQDYNLVHMTDGATFGERYQGTSIPADTFVEWRTKTGQDLNSVEGAPLFVDPANGDWHIQSAGGSYHDGVWSNDAVSSPGIDIGYGQPSGEPEPNTSAFSTANTGARNVGAYGGTEQASKTPSARSLRLDTPIGGENFLNQAKLVQIRWGLSGTAWQSNDTVRLEYSADSGSRWKPIEGADSLAVYSGANAWDSSSLPAGQFYQVRVTCNQEPGVTDQSRADFRIGKGLIYYINDTSTTQDVWCTAIGSDTNSGAFPSHPKATLQSLMFTYDLEPGDTVRIDTGDYLLTNNIVVETDDGGASDADVTFESSPHGVVMDRASATSGSYGWLVEADYVTMRTTPSAAIGGTGRNWWRIHGAYMGMRVMGSHCKMERIEFDSNANAGLHCAGDYAVVRNCLSHHNTFGLLLINGDYDLIENCTVVLNSSTQVHTGWSSMTKLEVRNCILWADGSGGKLITFEGADLAYSDYNLVYITGGATFGSRYQAFSTTVTADTLDEWQQKTGQDAHSVEGDPLFENVVGNNYRPQPDSPSINLGLTTVRALTDYDISGKPRVRSDAVDVGAFETAFAVSLRLWLQGSYDPATQSMRSSPHSIPSQAPYATHPRILDDVPSNIVDWVLVELRSPDGNGSMDARSALVNTNGYLVSDTGLQSVEVDVAAGQTANITVKHRNHLAATSAAPLVFTNLLMQYDFTTGPDKYMGGTNACVELEPGVWGMIAGDCDGDGKVSDVDRQIISNQLGKIGYLVGDLNLDGVVTEEDVP